MTENGETATGLVDWERGQPGGLPQTDLIHLWMTSKMAVEERELGEVVRRAAERWRAGGAHRETRARKRVGGAGPRHGADGVAPPCGRQRRQVEPLPAQPHLGAQEPGPGPRHRSPRSRRRPAAPRRSSPVPSAPAAGAAPARRPRIQLPRIERPRLPRPDIDISRRCGELRARIDATPREVLAACGALTLAVILWLVSLPGVDPRAMTEIGLVSVLPATYFVAIGAADGELRAAAPPLRRAQAPARRARSRADRLPARDPDDGLRDAALLVGLEARRDRRLLPAPRRRQAEHRSTSTSTTTGPASSASTRCSPSSPDCTT